MSANTIKVRKGLFWLGILTAIAISLFILATGKSTLSFFESHLLVPALFFLACLSIGLSTAIRKREEAAELHKTNAATLLKKEQ